jgi:hypothetical protein
MSRCTADIETSPMTNEGKVMNEIKKTVKDMSALSL